MADFTGVERVAFNTAELATDHPIQRGGIALDIDPQALEATSENARRNDVADRLVATNRIEPEDLKCDILMANILAGPLTELAETIANMTSMNGTAVLSGILENQADGVAAAFAGHFTVTTYDIRDGWAALACRRC